MTGYPTTVKKPASSINRTLRPALSLTKSDDMEFGEYMKPRRTKGQCQISSENIARGSRYHQKSLEICNAGNMMHTEFPNNFLPAQCEKKSSEIKDLRPF
jgi:hypothetical protein